MKLTEKQRDELWGETGPYSQVNLKIENRILDDRISRVFLIVETEINPLTFRIIKGLSPNVPMRHPEPRLRGEGSRG